MKINSEVLFGVNIAVACLGIFAIYKATQIDIQIDDAVNTYLDKKITDTKLKPLVDESINRVATKQKIDAIVETKLPSVVEERIQTEIEKQVKAKILLLMPDTAFAAEIKTSIAEFPLDAEFEQNIANNLARDPLFIEKVIQTLSNQNY
jgi:hypothetical protein